METNVFLLKKRSFYLAEKEPQRPKMPDKSVGYGSFDAPISLHPLIPEFFLKNALCKNKVSINTGVSEDFYRPINSEYPNRVGR